MNVRLKKINFTFNIPEDPAFSTGDAHFFQG